MMKLHLLIQTTQSKCAAAVIPGEESGDSERQSLIGRNWRFRMLSEAGRHVGARWRSFISPSAACPAGMISQPV